MPQNEFVHVVSLGAWCQVAEQVKRCFGEVTTGPFDWLVSPLESVIKILNDDARSLGSDAVHLDLTAISTTYGCLYHHEFPRDADSRCIINEQALQDTQSKLKYKWASLKRALSNNEPTLFIRFGGDARPARAWPYHQNGTAIDSDDLNALDAALAAHFPDLTYTLLYIWHEDLHPGDFTKPLSSRIRLARMDEPGHRLWEGDTSTWQKVFSEHCIAHKPARPADAPPAVMDAPPDQSYCASTLAE